MIQLAHRIELRPNNKQKTYFMKACGVARKAWNWGLANWMSYYQFNCALPKEDRDKINGMMLKKEFNAIKKEQFPYMYEVTKYASQQPLLQLQAAYNNFFKGIAKYPKFKSRSAGDFSFYIGGDQIKFDEKKIWIPRLGLVRMNEKLRFGGKINSVTISKKAERWYASIQVETSNAQPQVPKQAVGVDLGIKNLVSLSNGLTITPLNPLKNHLKTLKGLQKRLSRGTKGSKRYLKLKRKIAKLHKRIADLRSNLLHKVTSSIVRNFSEIVIEDLNVAGMLKNHKLSRALSDVGMGEFRRQLEYKSQMYGNVLFVADRFYPSSKRCSECNHVKEELKLSERTYHCLECQSSIDRDLNAALNLEKLINKTGRPARPSLMTVEATALDSLGQLMSRNCARETVNKQQINMSRFA